MEPVEPVLSWPHFDDEPKVQEKEQVKDQQFCIFIFVVCLTIPTRNTSPDVTTAFHTRAHGRFIEIKRNLRREKRHGNN